MHLELLSLLGIEMSGPLALTYTAILIMAVVPIVVGSFFSLSVPMETMSAKDAYMFPVIGSCVLVGLYAAFKLLSPEYVNFLMTAYFLVFGLGAVTATFDPILHFFIPTKRNARKWKVTVPKIPFVSAPFDVEFSGIDIMALLLGTLTTAWYVVTKHWVANNVLGLCFSVQGVAMLSLGSYKIGCILLSGLFFYDIFWVFGTDVMVTVATKFDAPIKLLFPRNIFLADTKFSMLGLGDIVIPGVFVALLLRFDRSRTPKPRSGGPQPAWDKTYFVATLLAYVGGLATTIVVMHVFEAAQPALLYLVPYCMGVSTLTAVARGEVGKLWAYSEEDPKAAKKTE